MPTRASKRLSRRSTVARLATRRKAARVRFSTAAVDAALDVLAAEPDGPKGNWTAESRADMRRALNAALRVQRGKGKA